VRKKRNSDLIHLASWLVTAAGEPACSRGYTSNSEHPSFEPGFKNHIMEALLDECFTFYRSYAPGAGLEPPE